MDDLTKIKQLAGITASNTEGSTISMSGYEKSKLMKENNIKPGTSEWFKLWFSKPYLTGEKPI